MPGECVVVGDFRLSTPHGWNLPLIFREAEACDSAWPSQLKSWLIIDGFHEHKAGFRECVTRLQIRDC